MLLLGNGQLFTLGTKNRCIPNGAVFMKDGLISEVGETGTLRRKYPQAEFIDAKGGAILPGFINVHNHIYSAFARGLSIQGYSPKDFDDILEGQWWRMDRAMTLEDTRLSALATYVDCIRNGVTTVFDHHASYGSIEGSLSVIADAARQLGVRTSLCYEVSDRDGPQKARAAVMENANFIQKCQNDKSDKVKGMMGLHASFTLSDATLALCREYTPDDAGFHVHVAEGMTDVWDSLSKYGRRVVERLFDQKILGRHTVAGHCIHVGMREMDLLKETDTMVVHNPESNMGNAVGCPPTLTLMQHGVLTGLGTDGYTNDMLESMKAANCLHKHHLQNPTVAWAEVPQMLLQNNAAIAARFFKTPLGELKEGAAADVIVIDYDPLTPMTENNMNGHMLFGMNGRDVTTTIIAGELRMKNREVLHVDTQKLFAQCRKQAQDFWNRINA